MAASEFYIPTTTTANHSERNNEVSHDFHADVKSVIEDLKDLDIDALLAHISKKDTQEKSSVNAFNEVAGASVTHDNAELKVENEDGDVDAALPDAAANANRTNAPSPTGNGRQTRSSGSSTSSVQKVTSISSCSSFGVGSVIAGADSEMSISSAASLHRRGSISTTRATRIQKQETDQEDEDVIFIEEKPVMRAGVHKRRKRAASNASAVEEPEKKFFRFLQTYHRVADYAQYSMNASGDLTQFVSQQHVMKQWIEFNDKQK